MVLKRIVFENFINNFTEAEELREKEEKEHTSMVFSSRMYIFIFAKDAKTVLQSGLI